MLFSLLERLPFVSAYQNPLRFSEPGWWPTYPPKRPIISFIMCLLSRTQCKTPYMLCPPLMLTAILWDRNNKYFSCFKDENMRFREVNYLTQGRRHLPCSLLSLQEQCLACNPCSKNTTDCIEWLSDPKPICLAHLPRAFWRVSINGPNHTFLFYYPHIAPANNILWIFICFKFVLQKL